MNQPPRRRSWLQWSLRSILVLMLVVAAYCAGYMSSRPEVERLRQENEEMLVRAKQAQQKANQSLMQANAAMQKVITQQRQQRIEAGMKLDALERTQRSFPAVPLDDGP